MRTLILREQHGVSGPAPVDGRAHRRRARRRSRSSPLRALLCPSLPPRSPSVSPDRQTHLLDSQQNVPPFGTGSAYFCPQPPSAPLWLVVRGSAPVPAPAAEAPDARVAARRRRVVKRLLRELVAALPLPAAPAAPVAPAALVAAPPPVAASTSPEVPPDVRDAAVQAITTSNAESVARQEREPRLERDLRQLGYKSEGEEWVGGVRALRDSHVRLVLRQLRHIERLNRALDRAALDRVARAPSLLHATAPH